MKIHRNNLARLMAAFFCFVVIMIGKSHIAAFFEAIANPGRSHHSPPEIIMGGLLFSLALLAVAGLCRIFFEKD